MMTVRHNMESDQLQAPYDAPQPLARPASSGPACGGLHGIASTASLNRPRSAVMMADRSAISIANSETGQCNRWCLSMLDTLDKSHRGS
jgi:hypothetical protein